jgi:pimeloyl-ACP methyl ester carboxylesterase
MMCLAIAALALVVGLGVLVWRTASRFIWAGAGSGLRDPEPADFASAAAFSVVTDDAVRIAGLTIHPDRPACGVVVLCHAWGLRKERFYHHARWLTEHGLVVVAFDFRHCGESGRPARLWPEPLDHGLRDLEAVLVHVHAHVPEVSRGLSLMGFSYGGNVIIAHAGFSTTRYRALILDSTPLMPYQSYISSYLRMARARSSMRVVRQIADWLAVGLVTALLRGNRFFERAIASCARLGHTPLLYVVGDKDPYFPPDEACDFVDRYYAGPREIFRVPRGRHLTNHLAAGAEYQQRVLARLVDDPRPIERGTERGTG